MNQLVVFFNDAKVYPTGINAGGGESATLALAKAIQKRGWKVIACGNFPDGDAHDDGVDFWDFGKDYRLDKIADRLKTIGTFHCLASTIAHPFLLLREHANCISRVIFNHAPSAVASGLALSTVFELIDMMLCVSHAQQNMFRGWCPDTSKMRVVKNGFDPEIFQYQGPEGRDFNHVIFVGRIELWKGAHLVINAFPILKKKFPDLKISMYGDYSGWADIAQSRDSIMAQYPGLMLHGKAPQLEIAKKLREAGLLVFPSISFESAGLGVLDAQACGCPVLGFDVGGVKEYLFDGECGILQKDHSTEALVANMENLLSNPDLLATYSRNCLSKARQRTWDVVASDVIEVFNGLHTGSTVTATKNVLSELSLVPEFDRINNFKNFPVRQLLDDHQTIAEGKIVSSSLLEDALKSGVNLPSVFLCRGLQCETKGLASEALQSYRQALTIADQNDWQPSFYLTLLLAEQKDLKSAAVHAQEVLKRNPIFPMADMLQQVITAAG